MWCVVECFECCGDVVVLFDDVFDYVEYYIGVV